MPQVPSVLQATGGPPRQMPGSPQDMGRSMATGAKAAVENVLPGASDAASARDSYLLGQQIGPALREGRYGDAIKAFLDSTGAAIGVLPMVPSLAGVIRAFHGTPHTFEKFDLSKLGTGEGAQAFGTGLYFAENKAVAEGYRDTLSRGVRLDEAAVPVDHPLFGELNILTNNPNFDIAGEKKRLAEMAAYYDGAGGKDSKRWADLYRKDIAKWDEAEKLAPRLTRNEGSLYTVDLDVNHEDLLDWDAPLSQQSPKVQEALSRAGVVGSEDLGKLGKLRDRLSDLQAAADRASNPDPIYRQIDRVKQQIAAAGGASGKDIYWGLGAAPDAAAKLRDAGVPGIRYLDAGSRRGGDGTRNVVLFDDRLAQIAERNGQPVAPPKPAAERAAEGLSALADPRSWLKE